MKFTNLISAHLMYEGDGVIRRGTGTADAAAARIDHVTGVRAIELDARSVRAQTVWSWLHAMYERLERSAEAVERKRRETYLGQATNASELEQRLRSLETRRFALD
jgi:hypothetical protein